MYFPFGWPRVIKTPHVLTDRILQITCNRDREKVLFLILTDDSLSIWFCKPCVPIVCQRRQIKSIDKYGANVLAEWKPDSSMIVIATSEGHLLFYSVRVIDEQKGLYTQNDSPQLSLRRDTAELFIKEIIPAVQLHLVSEITVWDGRITGIVCISLYELMVSTTNNHVLRYKWDGIQNRDYNLDLRRIPFCINQQVSKAVPIVEENTYISYMDYSPLIGGFSIVLSDGRAAFLTASTFKFDPNQVQGIWAQGIEDATCTTMNHKYRLITFGRANSMCLMYYVDESTGGLELSHTCVLSTKDYPGDPGPVEQVLWTPDGCALVAAWSKGGFAMWSTFGALLTCSLGWDYGINVDIQRNNPLHIASMQFSVEGYQLWAVNHDETTHLIQIDFAKSPTSVNPCMSHHSHMYLQGDDKLYVNSTDSLTKMFSEQHFTKEDSVFGELSTTFNSTLADGKQWYVIQVPSTYSATNWPIRYSSIDSDGQNIVIAGRTGIAHYSLQVRRWHLFGNESQEKDFVVVGGLLWWRNRIVLGSYSILDDDDELRFYPKDTKLDNRFAKIIKLTSQIHLINIFQDQLITLGADSHLSIWQLKCGGGTAQQFDIYRTQLIDISGLTVHPACVTSVTLTCLNVAERHQQHNSNAAENSIVLNISGRLLLVHREGSSNNGEDYICSMPTLLASCVENIWIPVRRRPEKPHLTEALWLFCGSHGMQVWLPLSPPKDADKTHTFMSKRIMLPFHLKIYPLAILFEDAIILGAENDSTLYTSDQKSPFSLPFNVLQRSSQVYLHQILRQLIRRNLGYHAWEIARTCMSLPYFPHSLELLLHEVLEEEATSKEPIPDAQLPSIIEFIAEFPMFLETVVQCARKTEIALWPYLFSAAGKPKDLFQDCMMKNQLDTAASYLIILQNLETSAISRQYATLLLNTALEQSKWELAKDLVRFLRAIDPHDVESPRNSFILPTKRPLTQSQQPPVSPPIADDLSLILGQRVRSFSTTQAPKLSESIGKNAAKTSPDSSGISRKQSVPDYHAASGTTTAPSPPSLHQQQQKDVQSDNSTAREFFIDVILQKHARRLLCARRLSDLGYFAAHLDFHLVTWLQKERDRAAHLDDFTLTLKQLHEDFNWPYPLPPTKAEEDEIASVNGDGTSQTTQMNLLAVKCPLECSSSSRIGDSGYISLHGLVTTPLNTLADSPRHTKHLRSVSFDTPTKLATTTNVTHNTVLYPMTATNSGAIANSDSGTVSSTSNWGNDDGDDENKSSITTNSNWMPSVHIFEELSERQDGAKGSHRSEIQLRYLLQLLMEAGCLEWSLIVAVLLRDAMAVIRTVNATKSQEHNVMDVQRLRQGFLFLDFWAHQECSGYKPFMLAIRSQLPVLTDIIETKVQQQKLIQQQQQQTMPLSINVKQNMSNNNPSPISSLVSNSEIDAASKSSLRIGTIGKNEATTKSLASKNSTESSVAEQLTLNTSMNKSDSCNNAKNKSSISENKNNSCSIA